MKTGSSCFKARTHTLPCADTSTHNHKHTFQLYASLPVDWMRENLKTQHTKIKKKSFYAFKYLKRSLFSCCFVLSRRFLFMSINFSCIFGSASTIFRYIRHESCLVLSLFPPLSSSDEIFRRTQNKQLH